MQLQTRVFFNYNGTHNVRSPESIEDLQRRLYAGLRNRERFVFEIEDEGVMIIPYEVLCQTVIQLRVLHFYP